MKATLTKQPSLRSERRHGAHTEHVSLHDKRILITGGTTGIGRAIALRLSAEGARVLIFGRHQKELDDAMRDLEEGSAEALGMVADVTSARDMERVFARIDDAWGGLDILVANAAVAADALKEVSDGERGYALETNIGGYLRCAKLALSRMREHCHIVLIGSVSADNRNPGGSIYVATKAAIQGFAESFRQEVAADGIKVSLIEPGKTGSDMIDQDVNEQQESQERLEMLKAEDVAECVEYVLTQPRRCNVSQVTILPAREAKD